MVNSNQMPENKQFRATIGSREVLIETGKLAEQAGAAVTLRMGDTLVFATATMSAHPREGIDFFPLSVDYEERLYAAGRIPGSFMRREGRPSEASILIARVTDRPLRPLFPKDLRNEVQVIITPLSHDQENHADILSIVAASAALTISDVPWDGPIGACRVGLIDGEFVANPTIPEMENSQLDLRMAGTADAIIMVEAGANEVDEETMIRALRFGHDSMQDVIRVQQQMREQVGRPKREYEPAAINEALATEVENRVRGEIAEIVATRIERDDRNEALDVLRERVLAEYEAAALAPEEEPVSLAAVRDALNDTLKKEVRRRIIEDGIRPDGRGYRDIRPLAAEVDLVLSVSDAGLVGAVFLLCGIGLVIQFRMGSFAQGLAKPAAMLPLPLGLAAFMVGTLLTGKGRGAWLAKAGWLAYLVALGVLAAMLLLGRSFRGGTYLAGNLNPSEIVKPLLVLFLASYLSRHQKAFSETQKGIPVPPLHALLGLVALWAIPMLMTIALKDLGLMALLNAVLIVMPEYNRSFPALIKNALEWGSRPYGQNAWGDKPLAMAGASPGAIGTAAGQSQLRATLPLYGLVVMGQPEVYLHFKPGLIDEHFEVTDEQSRGFLENFVDKFIEWIERHGQHHPVSVAAE